MDHSQIDTAENVAKSIPRRTRRRSGAGTVCESIRVNIRVPEDVSADDPTVVSESVDLGAEGHRAIIMLDTSEDLGTCEKEIGRSVGQLITPLTRRTRVSDLFAIDNGAFAGFPEKEFFSLLERENGCRSLCKFVAVPDIVGSARRTLELFDHFKYRMAGWPLALVMQNGQEDLDIPWKQIAAVFIGGIDKKDGRGDWKLSVEVEQIIKCAQAMGKWVHVGRVNTHQRLDRFDDLKVDSVDGTGVSRYSWMRGQIDHPKLFDQKSCKKVANG